MFNLAKINRFGNRNALQYFEAADSIQLYSYADIYKQSAELSRCMSVHSMRKINVAILLPVHCPALLPTIVGIEHADCVSCFLDSSKNVQDIKVRLINFRTNIVLCDAKNLEKLQSINGKLNIAFKCTLFDTECAVVQLNDVTCPTEKKISIRNAKGKQLQSSKVFFYASTSASCGDVKFIGVTYKSFMPNINSLGKLYRLTGEDVLFVSSPQTFDPFMIDICLAIHHGASLLMTSNNLRCDAGRLLDILFPCMTVSSVTVIQITPSLFMRWTSSDIKHRIFCDASRLRILAFGGEHFPATTTLSKWMINLECKHSIRIFNLYGLTEMSCWAGIYELTTDDILCERKVPIGQPIDSYTRFQVNTGGELLLRSTVRKCFQTQLSYEEVCDDDFEFILHTGDLVSIENGLIYFQSRMDSVIKFYGRKINMAEIELHTKNVNLVEDAVCLFDEQHNMITLFVKVDGSFENIKKEIVQALQPIGIRVKIISVTEIPLTIHGKICKSKLLNAEHVNTNDKRSPPIVLSELINETLGTKIQLSGALKLPDLKKKSKGEGNSCFVHLGGNSLKAIQIVNELERITTQSLSYLLPMLLDERISIYEILSRLANDKSNSEILYVSGVQELVREIVPRWKIDMKKCIDATPTVFLLDNNEAFVSVGGHSKLLYNVSITTGDCISKLELPDRIESQVIQMGNFGFFGCYDGCMYSFEIRSGSIKWKFQTGAMIKCRALLINRSLLFGNYSESNNFWCLNVEDGSLLWSLKIGSKSIYANPVEIENGNVLVCSLDGTVALVNSLSANALWYFQSEAPVFSTPTVFRNNDHHHRLQIVILAVTGTMYGLNSDGSSLWTHHIDGNLFSSPQYFPNPMDNKCTNIVFGSQNRILYCHCINANNDCIEEIWKFTTSASIRSNPILVNKDDRFYVIIFSSDGLVTTVDSIDGKLISQRKIDGEIFSTPVIYDRNLFVGSRNNFLYCIDLNDLF